MERNESSVREFIAAWSRLDPKELASWFTEDGVYHNVPAAPVAGRENVEKLIRSFIAGWTETRWEIRNVLAQGDLVVVERVDHTRAGRRASRFRASASFEMQGGRIRVWRDYFDLGTYLRSMA
jgi:limonene-1,2-epoxide hydrolase